MGPQSSRSTPQAGYAQLGHAVARHTSAAAARQAALSNPRTTTSTRPSDRPIDGHRIDRAHAKRVLPDAALASAAGAEYLTEGQLAAVLKCSIRHLRNVRNGHAELTGWTYVLVGNSPRWCRTAGHLARIAGAS